MAFSLRTADTSTVRLEDALAGFWCALWLVLGAWTGYTLWQAADVGDTVTASGTAISSTGRALETMGQIPVVGDGPAKLGAQLQGTGADIADRGQRVHTQLRQLAVL